MCVCVCVCNKINRWPYETHFNDVTSELSSVPSTTCEDWRRKVFKPLNEQGGSFCASLCHAKEFISPLDILSRWCQNWTYEQNRIVDHMSQLEHTYICKLNYKKIYTRINDSDSNTTHKYYITVLMYDFIFIFLLDRGKHGCNTIQENVMFQYLTRVREIHQIFHVNKTLVL